jgi:protein-S-isoprenylcysteine O-methyltransferase Ste14
MLLRHAFAIAVLPFTVTVLVPRWLGAHGSPGDWWLVTASLVPFGIGLTLFVTSVYLFATSGRGTLAPWDPPKNLVVRGPYRWVRNPMISGVLFVLLGEAMFFRSVPVLVWFATFALLNAVYIPLIEEPDLEARFGDSYREYKRHVRRFVPRLTPL